MRYSTATLQRYKKYFAIYFYAPNFSKKIPLQTNILYFGGKDVTLYDYIPIYK